MQKRLGLDEADFGFILDDMVITTGRVAAGRSCAPRVAPEVACLLNISPRPATSERTPSGSS
jgi:2-oxo-3-hexenedioate decarboxylase/2-keto-4-pentenoate hydratase